MEFSLPNQNNQKYFNKPLSIQDFEFMGNSGGGQHGTVFKAKYKYDQNQTFYALKRIPQSHFLKNPNEKENQNEIDYLREKTILYDLTKRDCPNVIKLYGDFEDSQNRYLVLEYFQGKGLNKLKDNFNPNGYVSEAKVIIILTKLLETLKFLHNDCKIIHRDIKPDNIMIDSNNNIKLLDFGLSAYIEHSNNILVSKRSFKGAMQFVPDELLLDPNRDYGYKIDVFALGYTIYSLMNPSNNDNFILPKFTSKVNGAFQRVSQPLINTFYSPWLIEFVQLLYTNDQNERPKAAEALGLFLSLQNNPSTMLKYNQLKIQNNNIPNNRYNIIWRNPNINNNIFNNIPFNNMPNSSKQITVNQLSMLPPNKDFARGNTGVIRQSNQVEEFLQPNQGNENRIISSMKSLLQVFNRIGLIQFVNMQYLNNYQQTYIYTFYNMLNNINQLDIGSINKMYYNQLINNFIRNTFNNNKGEISGTRPIILYYMIASIFRDEFKKFFDNVYQNIIFDNIIKNNFCDYNNILPMANPQVYNEIKEAIFEFKNNYRGYLVDKFYFLVISVSTCDQCQGYIENKIQISPFLQLDIRNEKNNITELINNYFCKKIGMKNYNCETCGPRNQKYKRTFCLNLPDYLIVEFIDKNSVNFNDNISLPLYNGQKIFYQYLAGIYKFKTDNVTSFVAVIKNGNTYNFCVDDKLEPCPPDYINLDCPSLVIFKKI